MLATSFTPVLRLETLNPIAIKLAGEPTFQATLDPQAGATWKIAGAIERLAGLTGDVTVSLVDVPPGIGVPSFVVKADQTAFELELKFPPNYAPGPVKNVRLFALGKLKPDSPENVRSIELPLAITLAAPPKPPAQ